MALMMVFFVFVWVWSGVGGFEFPFLATAHFLARKYFGDGPLSLPLCKHVRATYIPTGDRFGGAQFPKFVLWRASIPEICPLAGLNSRILSRNFYSRHVEFLRAPRMNRHKNSGPKGLLWSLSLPTLRSFSPSFHTSTHRQFHW